MRRARIEARAERNWPRTFAISILISLAGLGLILGYVFFMDYLQMREMETESWALSYLYGMGVMFLVLMGFIIMMGCPILIMAPIIVLMAWVSDKVKRRRIKEL